MVVRTRFAPSPTGFLHVGGVRTALFSWLYARHHQGEFFLRIEDTDEARSTTESVDAIHEGMQWLGLVHDKEVVYQSQRYPRYAQMAAQLLQEGHAYRCTCSKQRLDDLRAAQMAAHEKPRYDGHCREKNLPMMDEPHVIRFKNPTTGIVSFTDHVYGAIHVNNQELDDLVIVRTDGNPTYNFAVVIDDWDMEITHVIRGDDHINNTPRQINLYTALNAPIPEFAHLPMILGEDGKRLSKRHGAVSVMEFKTLGILPAALLNYLVRLGWSHGDQEIFSLEEMITLFDLNHVSRGVSSFNYDKLYWLNQHYQKEASPTTVAQALAWHFAEKGVDIATGPALEDVVAIQAERCKTLVEMCEKSLFFYQDIEAYDEDALKKQLKLAVKAPLEALYQRLQHLSEWTPESLQATLHDVCTEFDVGFGKVAQPLRVAVTGSSMSPSMDVTLSLLGKKRVLERLAYGIQWITDHAVSL